MTESPRNLITVSFHITIVRLVGAQNFGDVACNAGLFGYANYHRDFEIRKWWNE